MSSLFTDHRQKLPDNEMYEILKQGVDTPFWKLVRAEYAFRAAKSMRDSASATSMDEAYRHANFCFAIDFAANWPESWIAVYEQQLKAIAKASVPPPGLTIVEDE